MSYRQRSDKEIVILCILLVTYFVGFYIFHNAGIARPHPSHYDNFLWGLLQGFYIGPSLILSLFNPDHYAIYQTPNIGAAYNIAFVLGVGCAYRGGGYYYN